MKKIGQAILVMLILGLYVWGCQEGSHPTDPLTSVNPTDYSNALTEIKTNVEEIEEITVTVPATYFVEFECFTDAVTITSGGPSYDVVDVNPKKSFSCKMCNGKMDTHGQRNTVETTEEQNDNGIVVNIYWTTYIEGTATSATSDQEFVVYKMQQDERGKNQDGKIKSWVMEVMEGVGDAPTLIWEREQTYKNGRVENVKEQYTCLP